MRAIRANLRSIPLLRDCAGRDVGSRANCAVTVPPVRSRLNFLLVLAFTLACNANVSKLTISQRTSTLAPRDVGHFAASGTWVDGSATDPVATFAATGGIIAADGLHTAGLTLATSRVIETQHGGAKTDRAGVTATIAAPVVLAPVTPPDDAVSGAPFKQPPAVELRNAQDQPVPQKTATVMLPSLRVLASARNFRIGTSVLATPLAAGGAYTATLAAQYNSVTPENEMKFGVIHPGPTQYAFSTADQLVSFAQANGISIHGHTLVWHESLPPWITGGTFTKAQLLAVLKDHITTVVGRYAGKLASWDVLNEAMLWNGSLRPGVWLNTIGPEYIDSAFVWAHRADPTAKLFYNEYSVEGLGQKADSVLALVRRLKARGVPIDGVGFQFHNFPAVPLPAASSVRANFARFTNAGIDIRVSEMDVMLADNAAGPSTLVAQAVVFRDILDACLLQTRCTGFTTWCFTDRYSFVSKSFPGYGRGCPFDASYRAKPAYDSLAARLRRG
jgi:endo-1,4-beta-xylanase